MLLSEWKTLENIKTLPELARRLGGDNTTNPAKLVHNWLNGKVKPSGKNMEKIIRATHGKVQPNDFYSQQN